MANQHEEETPANLTALRVEIGRQQKSFGGS